MAENIEFSGVDEHQEFQELNELSFDQVQRGSRILVYTDDDPTKVKSEPDYDIKVTGIRKDGLRVEVKPKSKATGGDFTARMAGVLKGGYPGRNYPDSYSTGIVEGVLQVATEEIAYRLQFDNLKDTEGYRMGKSSISSPIRKIIFKHTP